MIHPAAAKLIIEHEHFEPHPMWPKGDSGITWGYGWDAGYHTLEELNEDWLESGRMVCQDLASQHALTRIIGKRGAAAWSALTPVVKSCFCSKHDAAVVFETRSIPKYERITRQAFPGVEELPAEVYGALVSLVFNRGGGMGNMDNEVDWDRRREMREIRDAVKRQDLQAIADLIRSMKRLWEGRQMGGLLRRRDDEAALVETAIV